jgi:PAS domain S-box-containing protein
MDDYNDLDKTDLPLSLHSFLTHILDAAADGITAQDTSGNLIYANTKAAEMIGFPSPEALLTASIAEVMDRYEVFDEFGDPFPLNRLPGRQILEGHESAPVTLRFRVKETNVERWSILKSAAVYTKRHKIEFVVNTFHDITDLKNTEAALKAGEELFSEVVENASDCIFVLDSDGKFLTLNRACENLMGYSKDEIVKIPIKDLVYPEYLQTLEEIFEHNLSENGRGRKSYELNLRRKDGQLLALELNSGRLIRDSQSIAIHAIARDITERKQIEAKQLFLAEASSLLTSSLDYETTLANVARLMTPTISDWAGVDLVSDDGRLQRVAVSHVDPEKIAWAYQLRQEYPIDMSASTGLTNVIRTGKSEFYPDIPDEMLVAGAYNPKHLELMRGVGFRSALVVPLIAHGKNFGALTLVTTNDSGRLFTQFDLLMAEDLGRTAGLAIENALSYRQAEVERERLRVTLTSIGDAVIATDTDGNVTFLNTIAEKLVGWTNAEALGRPLTEVFHIVNEYSRKIVDNPIERVLETGLIVGLANHTLLISRDGREIPIEDSAAPIRATDETVHGAVLVFRDVTESRGIQLALEQATNNAELAVERLSRLQDLTSALSGAATMQQIAHICISQSLVSLEADMGVIALMRADGTALETIESYGNSPSAQYFETLPLDSSLPLVDTAKTGHAIWLETRDSFQRLYPGLFSNKSKPFKTQAFASLPLTIENKIIGSIGFNFSSPRNFNAGERAFMLSLAHQCAQALERARLYEAEMQAREAAEKANQLKMQFLAMISHELRSPLTAIKELTTSLLSQEQQFSMKEQEKFFDSLDEETGKLTKLVDQLLDLSRFQSGTLQIEPVAQPIETIINLANPELENLTEERHLVIYIAKNLPPVLADTQRIAQVLINLVANAVKFSPLNTHITIVASQLGDRVQIDVSDEGLGIPGDQRLSVFEAFRQNERKSPNDSQGAGLGLAICKAIVEAHHGEIWIQDKVIGTTISFNLPHVNLPARKK